MRRVSGTLRLDLSQYRELSVFAQFGAELDEATANRLEHGKRTSEALKQDVHCPMDVSHQVVMLYVTSKGFLKSVPVERITEFKDKFLKYFDINYSDIISALESGGELTMDMGIRIEEAVEAYSRFFLKEV